MPKVSDEHRENRRRQIQDAAVRCFVRKGFRGTSMSDIILESGLSAGAIYGHYGSKAELATAVASRVFDVNDPALHPSYDASGRPLHPVDFVGRMVIGLSRDQVGTALPIQVWGEATFDDDVRLLFDGVYARLRVGITIQIALWLEEVRGIPHEDAAVRAGALSVVFIGLVQGAIVQQTLVADFDLGLYLDTVRPLFDA